MPDSFASSEVDEHQRERRHRAARHRAEDVGVDRHLAPAEDREALLDRDGLDAQLRRRGGLVVERQERHARRVRAQLGQLDAADGAQELVGDLHEDARTVAGVGLSADGSAVIEVAQRGQTLGDDVVARHAGQRRDERDATGVVLVARVIQTLRRGRCRKMLDAHAGPFSRHHGWNSNTPGTTLASDSNTQFTYRHDRLRPTASPTR